jgi:hypothetical protein
MDKEELEFYLNIAYVTGPHRSCGGKRKYTTENEAKGAIKRENKRIKKEFHAYPCPFCYSWHIGRKMSKDELETYPMKLKPNEIKQLVACFI